MSEWQKVLSKSIGEAVSSHDNDWSMHGESTRAKGPCPHNFQRRRAKILNSEIFIATIRVSIATELKWKNLGSFKK